MTPSFYHDGSNFFDGYPTAQDKCFDFGQREAAGETEVSINFNGDYRWKCQPGVSWYLAAVNSGPTPTRADCEQWRCTKELGPLSSVPHRGGTGGRRKRNSAQLHCTFASQCSNRHAPPGCQPSDDCVSSESSRCCSKLQLVKSSADTTGTFWY